MRIRKFFIPRNFTFSFFIAKYNGSISAEHGLGFKKANYIHYSKSSSSVMLMKEIKGLLDPKVNGFQQENNICLFNSIGVWTRG